MLDMIRQFAGKPGHSEKVALAADLRQTVAEELAAPGGEPATCPHCGCTEFVRRGRDARGAQRYLRGGCARSFTARSRGLLARSKLAASQRVDFARCLADAPALRECAERCGTCLRTAWSVRHRACEVMASRLEPFRAVGEVQVDGKYFAESPGGNHARPAGHEGAGTFEMPRKRHRSGSDIHVRGLPDLRVCAVTGAGELGDDLAEVCCRGQASEADLLGVLRGRAGLGATAETDGKGEYAGALAALGAAHVTVDAKDRTTDNINVVNSMHSRLGHFMDGFHGVSTKHLQHYLDWFCHGEQFRGSDGDARERIYRHECDGTYQTSRKGYVGMPIPFPRYWELAA